MKTKICAVIILLLSTFLTGCFAEETTDEIKIGMIRYLNASEENMNELIKKIEQKNGENLSNYSTVYYDTLNSMEMGLNAGNIAEMSTYRSVSNYITGHNSALVPAPIAFKLSDSFCCAFRQEDSALRAFLPHPYPLPLYIRIFRIPCTSIVLCISYLLFTSFYIPLGYLISI